MNSKSESVHLMLSSNDQTIMNALNLAVNMGHENASKPKTFTNAKLDSVLTEPDSSLAASKCTAIEDSGCSTSFSYRFKTDNASFLLDPQYILLSKHIQQLNILCDMYDEKKKSLKEQNTFYLEQFFKRSEAVLSDSLLRQRLSQVSQLLEHVQKISKHCKELKEVLRNEVPEHCLKVEPSCQKSVFQFFQMSSVLIQNIEKDISCLKILDRNKTKVPDRNEVMFMSRISEETSAIQRRLDLLKDFRADPLLTNKEHSPEGTS